MLYRIEIENFYSFRDPQVLDLTIAPNVPDPDGRFAPLFPGSNLRAPKVIALYGANASGKTNFLRALKFLSAFTTSSLIRNPPGNPCFGFNDEHSSSRTIRFSVELGGAMDLSSPINEKPKARLQVNQGVYRYELNIEAAYGEPRRVLSETLRQKPGGKGKWQRVFERDAEGNITGSKSFPMAGYRHLTNTLAPDVSLIASFAAFQHPTALAVAQAAPNTHSNLDIALNEQDLVQWLGSQPDLLELLNRDLARIDTGVESMDVLNGASEQFLLFKHKGLQRKMSWELESHGTRAFIRLFPLLNAALRSGLIVILDEIDVLIHPVILPEILRWFYDSNRNPHNGQLWMSCHSASLLEELTKEEIVLCEKDNDGRTRVFSLMDVKAVRRDDNLYRKYLSGVYGAVPNIG